jgi:DNA invertase Pin-like site-specific DNA recombinase
MARFFLHVMMAFAELERELVVAGVKVARENGKQLGRPKRVFRRDEAARMRAEGMFWRKIAAELGVPVTTVVEGCRGRRDSSALIRQSIIARAGF